MVKNVNDAYDSIFQIEKTLQRREPTMARWKSLTVSAAPEHYLRSTEILQKVQAYLFSRLMVKNVNDAYDSIFKSKNTSEREPTMARWKGYHMANTQQKMVFCIFDGWGYHYRHRCVSRSKHSRLSRAPRISHWDRYLGMTAAKTQVPVPTAMAGQDLIPDSGIRCPPATACRTTVKKFFR